MRKILIAILALTLLLGLSAAALADDPTVAYPVEGGNIYFNPKT